MDISLEDIQKYKEEVRDRFAPLHRAVIDAFVYGLHQLPVAEVAPIRKGKWQFAGDGIVACSACEETYEAKLLPRNYCPNCGTKMRE